MNTYLKMLQHVLDTGKLEKNRTGIDRLSTHGYMFEHNMNDGFPLLTTKFVPLKMIAAELEFFIKGLSNKRWLQDRGCHIWDEWAKPSLVQTKLNYEMQHSDGSKNLIDVRKEIQLKENELGPIYGVQWTDWKNFYYNGFEVCCESINQLKNIIEKLKVDPTNTQLVVSAWNPSDIPEMALPPCHYAFQLLSDGETLDLCWNQRSCDLFLGIPFNVASYALLLLLISKETNLKPGKIVGFFADLHLYENQLEQAKIQLNREPYELPIVVIKDRENFSVFNWEYTECELINYKHHSKLKADVAI
jgi:thymidylate synthase